MRAHRPLLFFSVILLSHSISVAAELTARIIPSQTSPRISGLIWDSPLALPVLTETAEETIKITVVLKGRLERGEADWSFLSKKERIVLATDGSFEFRSEMRGKAESIEFLAIGPTGQIEKEEVKVYFDSWEEFKKGDPRDTETRLIKPAPFSVSLGVSSLSFQQSETVSPGKILSVSYSALSMTGKVSYLYRRAPTSKWDLGANCYFTLFPLSSSSDKIARFFGLSVRGGWKVPRISEPWSLTLMVGLYYTTMFVTDGSFGFANLGGPQFFPVIRRKILKNDLLSGYLKVSWVGSGAALQGLSNREYAGGLSWTHPLRNGHPFSVALDIANLALDLESIQQMNSTSYSLSAGYGL